MKLLESIISFQQEDFTLTINPLCGSNVNPVHPLLLFTTLRGSSANVNAWRWSLNAKKHRFGCPYTKQLKSSLTASHQRPRITKHIQVHRTVAKTLSHQPLCLAARLLQKRRLQKSMVSQSQRIYRISIYFHIFHSHQPNSP